MVYGNDSPVASNEAAGAPETEIEITPAMLKAGVAAYCRADFRVQEIEGVIWEIFEAMIDERSKIAN
jgi:hypothetical protein